MLRHCVLLLLLPLTVLGLGTRGSNSELLSFPELTSNVASPMTGKPVTLWCAPDNTAVTIKKAHFIRMSDKKKMEAEISPSRKNASLEFKAPTILDAADYQCELDTTNGKVQHKVALYSRPIAHSHDAYEADDDDEFELESGYVYAEPGGKINITCPVFGHPQPRVSWKKDDKPLDLSSSVSLIGNTLQLLDVKEEHAGEYTCEAVSEYKQNGKTVRTLLHLEKKLNVKSAYGWVVPLIVIVSTLVLLTLTILACELRKKRNANHQPVTPRR